MPAFPKLRRPRLRRGGGDAVLMVVVVAALVVAAGLLHYVASEAASINAHADDIAVETRGIKVNTDAISMLHRTNALATSILRSARPLDGELSDTVTLARRIDAKTTSINDSARSINDSAESINDSAQSIEEHANTILGTARAINTTAGNINAVAGNINTLAAAILDVTRRINLDVKRINLNLNTTIALARQIRSDTQDLVGEARYTHKEAACIDREVNVVRGAYNGGAFCDENVSR